MSGWRVMGRPEIPEGYGVEEGGDYLEWAEVEARLVAAIHYWVATSRPDGRPHVVPRWGVWVEDRFWYDGSPMTRHARNLRSNDSCALHLEDGAAPTIVEGRVTWPDPVQDPFGKLLSDEFKRKYEALGYAPEPDSWSGEHSGGLLVLTPIRAIAWSSFPGDLTRFEYGSADIPSGPGRGL